MALSSDSDHKENILAGYLTSPIIMDLGFVIILVIELSSTKAYIF